MLPSHAPHARKHHTRPIRGAFPAGPAPRDIPIHPNRLTLCAAHTALSNPGMRTRPEHPQFPMRDDVRNPISEINPCAVGARPNDINILDVEIIQGPEWA